MCWVPGPAVLSSCSLDAADTGPGCASSPLGFVTCQPGFLGNWQRFSEAVSMGKAGQQDDDEPLGLLWPEQTPCGRWLPWCRPPWHRPCLSYCFGGGALRSWLWHPGPWHSEILMRVCLGEAPGMQQGSEQWGTHARGEGDTAVQRRSLCARWIHSEKPGGSLASGHSTSDPAWVQAAPGAGSTWESAVTCCCLASDLGPGSRPACPQRLSSELCLEGWGQESMKLLHVDDPAAGVLSLTSLSPRGPG